MDAQGTGYACTSISSGLDHAQRDRVIKEFRDGTTRILISTDVLARGFDVQQVSCLFAQCMCSFLNGMSCVGVEQAMYALLLIACLDYSKKAKQHS